MHILAGPQVVTPCIISYVTYSLESRQAILPFFYRMRNRIVSVLLICREPWSQSNNHVQTDRATYTFIYIQTQSCSPPLSNAPLAWRYLCKLAVEHVPKLCLGALGESTVGPTTMGTSIMDATNIPHELPRHRRHPPAHSHFPIYSHGQ